MIYINKITGTKASNIDDKNQSIFGNIGNKIEAKVIGSLYAIIKKYPPVFAKYVHIAEIAIPRY